MRLFHDNHLAIVKEIDDGRGKVTITYTREIEHLIDTDEFKHDFFQYFKCSANKKFIRAWNIDKPKYESAQITEK